MKFLKATLLQKHAPFLLLFALFCACVVCWRRWRLRGSSFYDDLFDTIPPPTVDYSKLSSSILDFENFEYTLNVDPCDQESMLVLVHSAADHFNERDSLRLVWSSKLKNITHRVVFLLASVKEFRIQARLKLENKRYEDTVQGNFIDSYHNLTYKHIMGLKWATENCPRVTYLLKMDDDIFPETFKLSELAVDLYPKGVGRKAIACYIQQRMPVVRDVGSKWFVSKEEYPGRYFEKYCSGWAYVTTVATARLLVNESYYHSYFWIDDVHVTGTLAKKLGVRLVRLNKFFTTEADGLALWSATRSRYRWKYVFGPTWGDIGLVAKAHRKARWCRRVGCSCCFEPKTVVQEEEKLGKEEAAERGFALIVPIVDKRSARRGAKNATKSKNVFITAQ